MEGQTRKMSKEEEDNGGECDGAHPLSDKNWRGDLTTKNMKQTNIRRWWLIADGKGHGRY
jgi:hypothetical protein